MNRIFVDTSAWAALTDKDDTYYAFAISYQEKIAKQYRLLTTNYILDESYTLLFNVGYRQTVSFKRKLDFLVQRGILEVVWISKELAEEAWRIFEQYNTDKQWSFTDCISYVVMQQ
jgi:predicted nucleic acid-binding protein